MKWMKKLRLINWHYFQDETLEFGRQTLISGRNAAGKSTIIDALQVLVVADQRQIKFNPAAHEDATRSLISYLRGKKGTNEQTYVRDGDFSTYIAAEFEDARKKERFVVGVVIDVYRDDKWDEYYFIIQDVGVDDLNVVNEPGHLRNRDEFRRFCVGRYKSAKFEHHKGTYQKMLLHKMGQVPDRFFSVFTKALSFKPINNVRNFVYDYILDKKELQLDVMKENFRIHERYQRELEDLQIRQGMLQQIHDEFDQYQKLKDTIAVQEYVIRSLKHQEQVENRNQLESIVESLQKDLELIDEQVQRAQSDQDNAQQKTNEAYQAWQSHEHHKKQEELKNAIKKLAEEINVETRLFQTLQDRIIEERRLLEDLAESEIDTNVWTDEEIDYLWGATDCLAELLEEPESPTWIETDLEHSSQKLTEIGEFLSGLHLRFTKSLGRIEDNISELQRKKTELEVEVKNLENKKRPYPPSVERLRLVLQQQLQERSSVWILCEEMEVVEERWRNALEGYLNTQRFDLLVEPQVFAEALSIYEKEKWRHQLEGVGLVDTQKEQKYLGQFSAGSLAQELSADNPVIRARIDHLLGQVMKAKNEQDLRNHRVAITESCMSYHNLVARQIPKKVYEVPFIGAQAIVRLLEIKRNELNENSQKIEQATQRKVRLTKWVLRVADKKSQYHKIADHLNLPLEIQKKRADLTTKKAELSNLDIKEVIRLKEEYEKWKNDLSELGKQITALTKQKGKYENDLDSKRVILLTKKNAVRESMEYFEHWKSEYSIELIPRGQAKLKELESQDVPTTKKTEDWSRNKAGNISMLENRFQQVIQKRQLYNITYTYNQDTQSQSNTAYNELLNRISDVDIPKYKEQLEIALRQSEEEFQSHFVFKLREAIDMAKREFGRLNYALKNFPFHSDVYEFKVVPSDLYKKYYDIIMDPMMIEKGSLFDLHDEEKVNYLHELFEKVARGAIGEHEEFTDYRRYLDFDIEITSHGETFLFSKVLREKSGGETQTPFYIAILASFNLLYSEKTMRLVVFDEAFNKMDEARIQQALRLIKRMGIQMIAAVPDEKMAHMAPEVSTTLIVHRQEYRCFVDIIERMERTVETIEVNEEDDDSTGVPIQDTLFSLKQA
ncbi:ATP-binding protein [Tumebacillus lipolyticus]|uniref:ATP-binding protein n=1 Tax=Tumebacillus lipolyticus TaxID=1280370 RepID=A0ABW5A267_9BACL